MKFYTTFTLAILFLAPAAPALDVCVSTKGKIRGETAKKPCKEGKETATGFGLATDVSSNTSDIDAQQIALVEAHAALVALEARITALEPCLDRFCACSDGLTVEDTETSLLWERKTGTFDGSFPASGICETAAGGCPKFRDVNNRYKLSNAGTALDGNAYTDFLVNLNAGSGVGGHTDWRLPFISELQSILVGPGVTTVANADPPDTASGANATGQPTTCSASPCIDPDFAAVGGPTASSFYGSASTDVTDPFGAWFAGFNFGSVYNDSKTLDSFVRAVRAGSCSS
jgi:hypothetical protein